jgi:hypothetical protein
MKRAGMADLEAVVAIARRGSFRGAARELDVSPTAGLRGGWRARIFRLAQTTKDPK